MNSISIKARFLDLSNVEMPRNFWEKIENKDLDNDVNYANVVMK